MRRSIVAGNWKLNGSRESVKALAAGVSEAVVGLNGVDIIVCPTALHIETVSNVISGSNVKLGAQNASQHLSGAYTGEVAVEMIKEYGCEYAILGHSERREIFSESDQLIADKCLTAIDAGIVPILCLGELLSEREAGQTEAVIERQLVSVIEKIGIEKLSRSVIAYEPVWAIGTGVTATPEQAQEVHAFIRNIVKKMDATVAENISILYGGSVKPNNAEELFAQPDIDGGLIGGAALQVDDFVAICKAAV